jgi:hypothetical protein
VLASGPSSTKYVAMPPVAKMRMKQIMAALPLAICL